MPPPVQPSSTSTPQMPSHNPRRPSISSTMHWLSRKDPKHSPDRSPGLQGATVVRTPEDALRETNVRVTHDSRTEPSSSKLPLSRSSSPPLPPLPLPEEGEEELLEETPKRPSKPHRAVPAPPSPTPSSSSSLRPSLKSRSSTAVEDLPHVPPVPSHIPLSAPVSPFTPILMSPPLHPDSDPSNIIVTLETCTMTYKSTIATLCSRSSFLADYITSLTKPQNTSQASSVYSTASADVEAYRNHLASQGLLPAASAPSTSLHIFLDRPSAPYAHILTFLRTPSISPEYPSALPRGVQLSSLTQSTSSTLFNAKLEALLELRDETAYLGIDSLYRLCTDEIRQRLVHAPKHARGASHASINTMMGPGMMPAIGGGGPPSLHSHHASVYSLHTLIERGEGDMTTPGKGGLDRVSRGSESLDEDDTCELPPLSFPTSPLPLPTSMTGMATAPPAVTSHYIKNSSVQSLSSRTSAPTPSPSYTPPQSKSPSPTQTFTRPQLHKKSESVSVMPMQASPTPDSGRRPESRNKGRIMGGHRPSPSITVTPRPGWI